MYQFGLSPATAEVPSMSAVALGANRWASRVVVVLQLAAWSAVGIVLLQKGVSSLQKSPVDVSRNLTETNHTETRSIANLPMKKISAGSEESEGNADLSLEGISQDRNSENNFRDDTERKSIPGVIPFPTLTPNHLSVDEKSQNFNPDKNLFRNKENFKKKNRLTNLDDEEEQEEGEISTTLSSVHRTTTILEKEEKGFENRKKIRNYNLSGGGAAAAAVAMIAVGAVMLILGPIVIILRALDERRQERRFLKLSGQDDLPPSYEQATLMDEAPRYSTLSLNTISCSPAATTASSSSSSNDSQTVGEVREV